MRSGYFWRMRAASCSRLSGKGGAGKSTEEVRRRRGKGSCTDIFGKVRRVRQDGESVGVAIHGKVRNVARTGGVLFLEGTHGLRCAG